MWLIISDSHDNVEKAKKISGISKINHVDHIFHLGDFVSPFMVQYFLGEDHEFTGVFGNNDGDMLFLQKKAESLESRILRSPNWVNVDGKKIYLMHEPRALYPAIASQIYDFVFFGHTHRLIVKKFGRTIVINPGESCGTLTGRATCVLLDPKNLETRVIEL